MKTNANRRPSADQVSDKEGAILSICNRLWRHSENNTWTVSCVFYRPLNPIQFRLSFFPFLWLIWLLLFISFHFHCAIVSGKSRLSRKRHGTPKLGEKRWPRPQFGYQVRGVDHNFHNTSADGRIEKKNLTHFLTHHKNKWLPDHWLDRRDGPLARRRHYRFHPFGPGVFVCDLSVYCVSVIRGKT